MKEYSETEEVHGGLLQLASSAPHQYVCLYLAPVNIVKLQKRNQCQPHGRLMWPHKIDGPPLDLAY